MSKRKSQYAKYKKKGAQKEGYAKRGAVKVPRRTWFLVVQVPQNKKNSFPKDEKSQKGVSVLNTSSKRRFDRIVC